MDGVALRRHGNQNLSARHGILSYELLAREAPGASRTTQAVTVALGGPLYLNVNPLFW